MVCCEWTEETGGVGLIGVAGVLAGRWLASYTLSLYLSLCLSRYLSLSHTHTHIQVAGVIHASGRTALRVVPPVEGASHLPVVRKLVI